MIGRRSRPDNALFHRKGSLYSAIEGQRRQLVETVSAIPPRELLDASQDDLVAKLVERFSINVPTLREDEISVAHQEVKVPTTDVFERAGSVTMTEFSFHVPFDGEADLFHFQASTSTTRLPRGDVEQGELTLRVTQMDGDAAQVKQQFESELDLVKSHLDWARSDAEAFNNSLEVEVRVAVDQRRGKLVVDAKKLADLGYPIHKRDRAPATYTVPAVRPKPAVQRPSTTKAAVPEPTLAAAEYEAILSIIDNVGKAMELSPSAFAGMGEEDLRMHFLVTLNGQYAGEAMAEAFNLGGKTDILIRHEGRNLFIAEFKFWTGPKSLTDALTQLLSYSSWRDTKTALILFNRGGQLSKVLSKVPSTAAAHPQYRRQLPYASETAFRFIFAQPNDPERELTVTVMVFEVPGGSSGSGP